MKQSERRDWVNGRESRSMAQHARDIHMNGFVATGSDSIGEPYYTYQEAFAIWFDTGKEERYAHHAEFIDRVYTAARLHIPEREPFGLVKKIPSIDFKTLVPTHGYEIVDGFLQRNIFEELGGYMSDTLLAAEEEVMTDLSKRNDEGSLSEKDRIFYERYMKWMQFAQMYMHGFGIRPYEILGSGIKTAIDTMADILAIIPSVYYQNKSEDIANPDELAKIASNSYSPVAYLAGFELFSMVHAAQLLTGGTTLGPFLPENFTLDKNEAGEDKLAFTEAAKQKLDTIRQNIKLMQGARLACPGMVDFGEGSAIDRLWRWHVKLASPIYRVLNAQGELSKDCFSPS